MSGAWGAAEPGWPTDAVSGSRLAAGGARNRCLEAASKMFASPSEPDAARPDLACQILHAILPEGLLKKKAAGPCHGPRWPERPPRAGL